MVYPAATVWRDYVTDGVPSSGKHKPRKADVREWGTSLEYLANLAYASARVYSTRATLYADLAHGANTPAIVLGDPTLGYDGLYMKVGASGSGSWSRLGDVPGYSIIRATDVGAGTANAIQATAASIPRADGAALIVLNIHEANNASPVTVSFNGGSPLTIKTNTGNDIEPSGLVAGMLVAGFIFGSTFRIITDQVSSAIIAAAELAADEAQAAASSVQSIRDSHADAEANYHPVSAPNFIRTAGYTTGGDGGAALYRKTADEPAHAGKMSITLDPSGTQWYEIVPEYGILDPRQVGAIMDGEIDIDDAYSEHTPDGTGEMSGTDNYDEMRAAYEVAAHFGVKLWLAGFYYVAVPDVATSNIIEVENVHIDGIGPDLCGILFGGSHSYTSDPQQSANTMIGPPSRYSSSTDRTLYDYFIIENCTLRGAWWYEVEKANRLWDTTFPYRVHGPSPWNYRYARLENVRVWDAIGYGIYGKACTEMKVINCDVRRNTADGIRGEDVSDYTVRDCFIDSSGDDAITNPQNDAVSNAVRPRLGRVLVTGNRIVRSEGMVLLGAAQTIVTNNMLKICHGTGLAVYAPSVEDTNSMGEGGVRTFIVANNVIEDQLHAPTTSASKPGTWSAAVANGITINGGVAAAMSTTVPLGESAGSDANPPWYGTDFGWGALHLYDAVDNPYTNINAGASGYRAYGVIITNNHIVRTLPAVATYDLWGMGKRHMRWGYENPEVTDARFALHAMRFGGMFDSAIVAGNEIKGFIAGAGIFLDDAENDMWYRSFLITGNTIKDVRRGIYTDTGGTHYQDITISNNIIDVDPRRIQAERDKTSGDHGKWTLADATAPACIWMTACRGLKVLNNIFMNAANPWLLEGGATESVIYNTIRGNIGVVDFVDGTASGTTDAANRGLGRIHRVSPMITYEVRDLDPESLTYNQVRQAMQHYSATMPGTGYYVVGHKVDRTTGGYWQRLTTGTAHVLDTDWKLVS